MAQNEQHQGPDSVSSWLSEAKKDYFTMSSPIDSATIVRAAVGFVVFAVGVGVIISQVL